MDRAPFALLCLTVLLAGCSDPPEYDTAFGAEPEGAAFPEIRPIGALLETAGVETPEETAAANAALAERAERLRARTGAF